ncbi:MAG: DUF1569 domain-containing protein [Planctomycetaceae bacterium]
MTKNAERRELNFNSLDEAVAEAERLASGEVRTTGNHTFAEILKHLALTHDMSSGKVSGPRPPWYMRLMIPLMKGMIFKGGAKPGFKLPADAEAFFWPKEEFSVADALAHLKESVEHYKQKGPLAVHPVFGKATSEQVDRLNCTHCAMHLSFVHPV